MVNKLNNRNILIIISYKIVLSSYLLSYLKVDYRSALGRLINLSALVILAITDVLQSLAFLL